MDGDKDLTVVGKVWCWEEVIVGGCGGMDNGDWTRKVTGN